MTFTKRMGRCQMCGAEMMLNSSSHKYCKECRKIAESSIAVENRKKEIARRIAIKRGTDPDRYKGLEYVCHVKQSCKWGSNDSCMWGAIHGRLRILAGYPIRGGKCDAYEKGKKDRQSLMQLTALDIGRGKYKEV